jgi:hypothetical protein
MLHFDHTYTADPRHKFLKRLEKLGFVLDEKEVEHPGRQFCRFILFASAKNPRKYTYLEFVNAKPGGDPVTKPGISFGYSNGLERFYRSLQKRGRYRAKFVHKNYDWKKDDVTRLPGWNFVTFEGLGLRGLFPWLTEYEPSPSRPKRKPVPKHPNGVFRHRGFVLELNPAGEKFLSYLLGRKLTPVTKLRCGTELYVTRARRTRVRAVVMECRSLPRFAERYGVATETFRGQPAARIVNPAGMWDLLIT